QHLRVGDALDAGPRRQDDGGRYHRTGERSHADLVDAGDVSDADPPEQRLEVRSRGHRPAPALRPSTLHGSPPRSASRTKRGAALSKGGGAPPTEKRAEGGERRALVPAVDAVVPGEADRLGARARRGEAEGESLRAAVEE